MEKKGCLTTLILIQLLLASNLGVDGLPVLKFQVDGRFSNESFAALYPLVEEDLYNFTLCLRMRLEHLRGIDSFILTVADDLVFTSHSIGIGMTKDVMDIFGCKDTGSYYSCVSYPWPLSRFRVWTHVCMQMQAKDDRYFIDLHVDGQHIGRDEQRTSGNGTSFPLRRSSSLVLAQDQDGVMANFEPDQAFCGSITDLNLWSVLLDSDDISKMAKCETTASEVRSESLLVKWPESTFDGSRWTLSNVGVTEMIVEKSERCFNDDPFNQRLVMTDSVSPNQMTWMCRLVNGHISVATEPYNNSIYNHFLAVLNELDEPSPCNSLALGPLVMLGQRFDDRQQKWIDPFNKVNESIIQLRKGSKDERCAYHLGPRISAAVCSSRYVCGTCHLEKGSWFRLKGLCDESVGTLANFDRDMDLNGVIGNRPHFKGRMNSHIFFDTDFKRWKLQSLRHPFTSLLMNGRHLIPLGRREWTVVDEESWPCQSTKKVVLTLSQCFDNMFTCDSGHCIPLSKRCDSEIDCRDKSDENHCQLVHMGADYTRAVIPSEREGGAANVYLNVSILAFPEIETFDLRLTANFKLNLRWSDARLTLYDLSWIISVNSLSAQDRQRIWTPRVSFVNALGPLHSLVDGQTSSVAIRETPPMPDDPQMATEALRYPGKFNAISMMREYYHDYQCHFDLHYYPFDTQVCVLIFEVAGNSASEVQLKQDFDGVEFLGNRILVEYEIQLEVFNIRTVNQTSRAEVTVVFRRRMEYHVTNTFLQSFILVCVGFMSLFFPLNSFTDRIMVTLTTMLVMATISTSIQNNLPKTSYYKLIDWWLLYSINVLVVTMGFHTYVENLCIAIKDEQRRKMKDIEANEKCRTITVNGRQIKVKKALDASASCRSVGWKEGDERYARVNRINLYGKVILLLSMIIINGILLAVALEEYLRPPEHYLDLGRV